MKYRRQRTVAGKTGTSNLGLTNIMVFLPRILDGSIDIIVSIAADKHQISLI